MKKVNVFLATFVSVALFAACTNEMDEWYGQDDLQTAIETRGAMATISLASELDSFTLNSSNGISTTGGYYWNQTYTNTNFQTTNFKFSHTGGSVSGYNYWDGFTISNVADTTNYGTYGSGGSNVWIDHQWGCMAVPNGTVDPPNFLVGYWGYYMLDWQNEITPTTVFGENKYSNWVKLGNDTQTYTVSEVTVAMHPWAYFGVKSGDGFATPFGPGDSFEIIIYGVKADGKFVTSSGNVVSKTEKLADYPNTPGAKLQIIKDWKPITINFGEPIKYLVFQIYTSDEDPQWGPNTAVYFCLRDVVME